MLADEICLFSLGGPCDFGLSFAQCMGLELTDWEEQVFPDGEQRAMYRTPVQGRHVVVIQSLRASLTESVNDKLCRLLFFIAALRDASTRCVTVVAPYLCYARQDRKLTLQEPLTSRSVAQLIEAAGMDQLMALDVHNPAAFQSGFRKSCMHLEANGLFAAHLGDQGEGGLGNDDVCVMAPDCGGIKRANGFRASLAQHLGRPVAAAYLDKQTPGPLPTSLVGPVKGKTVIILDDMITTGQTLIGAAQACRAQGAVRILAAASHGVFAPGAETCLRGDLLDRIVITNSIPLTPVVAETLKDKLAVLDCAPLFADGLRRLQPALADAQPSSSAAPGGRCR